MQTKTAICDISYLLGLILMLTIPYQLSTPVRGTPIKMVSDFPSYAFALFGHGNGEHQFDDGSSVREIVKMLSSTGSIDLSANSVEDDSDDSIVGSDPIPDFHGTNSTEAWIAIDNQNITDSTEQESSTISLLNKSDEINNTISNNHTNLKMNSILTARKSSYRIHLPNGHSWQFCDTKDPNSKCDDKNAVCKLDACLCRDGYVYKDGVCTSYSDLLIDCVSDTQCQALDVNLICHTDSSLNRFCDCADGLYYDRINRACLPCFRGMMILYRDSSGLLTVSNSKSNQTTSNNQTITLSGQPTKVRPCFRESNPNSTQTSGFGRRKPPILLNPQNFLEDTLPSPFTTTIPTIHEEFLIPTSTNNLKPLRVPTHNHVQSSDPFKMRTPIQVFMGAIMLFTMVSVAWFLLQRMIHDCRSIFRTIRQSEYTFNSTTSSGNTGIGCSPLTDPTITGIGYNNINSSNASQTVARLLGGEAPLLQQHVNGIPTSLFTRDLAGVIVQHLTANLSPSSTNPTLTSTNGQGQTTAATTNSGVANEVTTQNQDDIGASVYSFDQQARSAAAAAAAAQFLLQPTSPAIAILRAVAANSVAAAAAAQFSSAGNSGPEGSLNPLSPNNLIDPPPKYEEAIATRPTGSESTQNQTVPPYTVVVHSGQGSGAVATTTITPTRFGRTDASVSPLPISRPSRSTPPPPPFLPDSPVSEPEIFSFPRNVVFDEVSLTSSDTVNNDEPEPTSRNASEENEQNLSREEQSARRLFITPGYHPPYPFETFAERLFRHPSNRRGRGSKAYPDRSTSQKPRDSSDSPDEE